MDILSFLFKFALVVGVVWFVVAWSVFIIAYGTLFIWMILPCLLGLVLAVWLWISGFDNHAVVVAIVAVVFQKYWGNIPFVSAVADSLGHFFEYGFKKK